ncbi:transmembrane protein 74B [Chlamydotis macqueenii]
MAGELVRMPEACERAEGSGDVTDKSSRQLSAAHPPSLRIYIHKPISRHGSRRRNSTRRVRSRAKSALLPLGAPTAAPAPARGSGDAAGAGGGSMASPRAAERRSPGEAAAAAAASGGGPAGPGAGPGLALALGCALSGAVLVLLAGAVPRAARPDPAVPARQMERLEERAARLRARLDRCTVAGLALLALGGLLLAALLLAAAAARRRARAARRTGGTYGSVCLRMRRVSGEGTRALLENQLSPPARSPEGPGS